MQLDVIHTGRNRDNRDSQCFFCIGPHSQPVDELVDNPITGSRCKNTSHDSMSAAFQVRVKKLRTHSQSRFISLAIASACFAYLVSEQRCIGYQLPMM